MKRMQRTSPLGLFLLPLLMAFISCTTPPEVSDHPAATLRRVPFSMVGAEFGNSRAASAFKPKTSLVFGKKNEFVVVAIELNLAKRSRVDIDAVLSSGDSGLAMSAASRESMIDYWTTNAASDKESAVVLDAIERYYLPNKSMTASPGRHSYYMVVVGPNPLPLPASLEVKVRIDEVTSCEERFDILVASEL
ncbi:MAG: hypothetical protein JNG85_01010 [Spirochaetaceae bacterium]|nr:hypothetical protein [Spirochaetaceae bacterium]